SGGRTVGLTCPATDVRDPRPESEGTQRGRPDARRRLRSSPGPSALVAAGAGAPGRPSDAARPSRSGRARVGVHDSTRGAGALGRSRPRPARGRFSRRSREVFCASGPDGGSLRRTPPSGDPRGGWRLPRGRWRLRGLSHDARPRPAGAPDEINVPGPPGVRGGGDKGPPHRGRIASRVPAPKPALGLRPVAVGPPPARPRG